MHQNKCIYFDNAATTFPKPKEVYEFANQFYMECGVNSGRGVYPLAQKAEHLIEETREQCLDLFHIRSGKKVVFTSSATECINLVLQGISYENIKNVYISPLEHNAILRTIYHLQRLYKFNIIRLSLCQNNLKFDMEKIKDQFKRNPPDLIALTHVSNVCGAISPFTEIFRLAKKYDAITLLDMAQSAGLIDTDLSGDIVDFSVFAGHKTLYAPFGVAGVLMDAKRSINPLLFGGTGVNSKDKYMPKAIPTGLEAGSKNIYAIAGLSAALRWINKIGIDKIYAHEKHNTKALLDMLSIYDNIHTIETSEHIAVVSCTFDDYTPEEIGFILSQHAIAVRTGLHCAPLAHKILGTLPAGSVRFSVGYFNTQDDLNCLKIVLDRISTSDLT